MGINCLRCHILGARHAHTPKNLNHELCERHRKVQWHTTCALVEGTSTTANAMMKISVVRFILGTLKSFEQRVVTMSGWMRVAEMVREKRYGVANSMGVRSHARRSAASLKSLACPIRDSLSVLTLTAALSNNSISTTSTSSTSS